MISHSSRADVRYAILQSAFNHGVEVVYCRYDEETSQWDVELQRQQTLPPNPDNTPDVRVTECITHRARVMLRHDLDSPGNTPGEVVKKVRVILAQLDNASKDAYTRALDGRIEHHG